MFLLVLGKGTQVWKKSGAIYDGDWKNNMREGFGTYSIRQGGVHMKQYAGSWKNDMRDVSQSAPYTHCETTRDRLYPHHWEPMCVHKLFPQCNLTISNNIHADFQSPHPPWSYT